ncbi:MAG TPA: proprotein convertase P-domain-containing protein, partial [Casimicrobiaceae bacterium]|nr:proprotein convertase P-domain-containing protein [Casimicrobiaceae bacterium]
EWLSVLGLTWTPAARSGKASLQQAAILGKLREFCAFTPGAVQALLAPVLGYVNPSSLVVYETKRASLTAVHTYIDAPIAAQQAIPGNASSLVRTLWVPDGGFLGRSGVQLVVEITHPNVQNLTIQLTSPGGLYTKSWTNIGQGSVTAQTIQLYGAEFVGLQAGPTWTLTIMDAAASSTGSLLQWSLFCEGVGNGGLGSDIWYWGVYADPNLVGSNGNAPDYLNAERAILRIKHAHTVGHVLRSLVPTPDAPLTIPDLALPALGQSIAAPVGDKLGVCYYTGATPAIKDGDLHALQKEAVRSNRATRGGESFLYDEFTGDSLNRYKWQNNAGVTIADDSANGAFGIAEIVNTGSGGQLQTNAAYAIGLYDFRFRYRARFPNYATIANALDAFMGISGVQFHVTRTAGNTFNVQARVGAAGTGIQPQDHDTGVAVPTGSYVEFEIRKEGTTLSFLINDVVVYSQSFTTVLGGFPFLISTNYNASAPAGCISVFVDYVKTYVEPEPVSAPSAAQPTGSHLESQTIALAAQDRVTVTWSTPFADTTYRLPAPCVYSNPAAGVVKASYQNKTQNGIDIVLSDVTTGELYVEAHE